jgi:hypothetical protein
MNISMTTDYLADEGDPSPYLRRIADVGFTHVHWCHHWNTDYLYARSEVDQIAHWLAEFGLTLLNVHGSNGREKCWYAPEEYRRRAGVELVANRRRWRRLGSDVVIMHTILERPEEREGVLGCVVLPAASLSLSPALGAHRRENLNDPALGHHCAHLRACSPTTWALRFRARQ